MQKQFFLLLRLATLAASTIETLNYSPGALWQIDGFPDAKSLYLGTANGNRKKHKLNFRVSEISRHVSCQCNPHEKEIPMFNRVRTASLWRHVY